MKRFLSSLILLCLIISYFTLPVFAAPSDAQFLQEAEERKALPIDTNQIANWPAGPEIGAEGAILLEANTGIVLYAKNPDERLYPASTTKLMTCLIAAEKCSMTEMVSFSHNAVFSIGQGSSNIGIDEGQSMPMKECLYGILTASANEVANAVAEHVAGNMDDFVILMNQKAEDLGCTNTHFVNANGLFNEEHYTSARDLAIIAASFFKNEQLAKIANTPSYHFEATATQPDDFVVRNKHQLISGEIKYEGIKGGKTGYTGEARQTLVTCAEKDGMKLICVIMKEENPYQFTDTVSLFEYGFSNFIPTNVSENEVSYHIQTIDYFHNSNDILGNSNELLSLDKNSYLIMPRNVSFEDLTSVISYDVKSKDQLAILNYYYHGAYVGTAYINILPYTPSVKKENLDDTSSGLTGFIDLSASKIITYDQNHNIVVINVKYVVILLPCIALLLILISFVISYFKNYNVLNDYKQKRKSRRIKSFSGNRRDFHF